MSVQNELLGDVPESPFDRLNRDLLSEAVLSFPHGNSKREEFVGVHGVVGGAVGPIESFVVVRPRFPPAVTFGPIHCGSFNRVPRNVAKTLDFTHGGVDASAHG